MASGTGTNIALRTMIMIGALLVLLLMALLPGPVGWLVGGGQAGETAREPTVHSGPPRAAMDLATVVDGGVDYGPGPAAITDESPRPGRSTPRRPSAGDTGEAAGALGEVETVGAGGASSVDRCQSITAELRREGAAYYRLESWEGEPQVFRFQCTMTVDKAAEGGEPVYRTFAAAGNDPAEAMEQVLADVRAWQQSGRY